MDDSPRASKRRKIDTPKRAASSPATKPTTRKASGRLAKQSGSNANGDHVSDVEEEPAKQPKGRLAKGATNATPAKPVAVEEIDVYDDIEGALNIKPSSRPTRRTIQGIPKETTASVGHVADELQESTTTPKRGNAKPTPTPKRRAADDEWDLHRDDILKLYVEENKPLSEVITTMESQGFGRT
jgi:origin recognition complex subunit 4